MSYRVDYDLIAHLYDEPQRDHGVDPGLSLFLSQRPAIDPRQMAVLDMGCGTGKQLAANRGRFSDASLTGMDFFLGMLKQARKRSRDVFWVQGDSASPPFSSTSFDYITNQFSYPHVREKSRLVAETYRLLSSGRRADDSGQVRRVAGDNSGRQSGFSLSWRSPSTRLAGDASDDPPPSRARTRRAGGNLAPVPAASSRTRGPRQAR